MDNKIFKRIVAAAAGVTMLGTCAFATGLTTASYEDGTLSFDYTVAEGATKVTYLAYAATVAGENDTTFTTVDGTNYVLGNIVAVNQLDEIPETKSEAVAISADLLGEATNIVLMSGDDLGSDVALAAVATAPAAPAVTVTFVNGETSTTLAVDKLSELAKPADIALADANPVEGETYAASKITFLGWTDGADSETVYLHNEADKPAYEVSGNSAYNPSGATYKTLADLASITESVTLYAKYDTGYVKGDVDGSGTVVAKDRVAVIAYCKPAKTVVNGTNTGRKIFPLIDDVAGDVDGSGTVVAKDRVAVIAYCKPAKTVVNGTQTAQHIYFVNDNK